MNELVRLFTDIVFHRRGPADVPARDVLGKTLVAYLVVGAVALAPSSRGMGEVVAQLAVDLAIVLLLFGGLLAFTGRGHRLRQTLTALARSGRVLEINTRLPLDPLIVRWWHEVGGAAVSFGSDAHTGARVAHGFEQAMVVAEAAGFRPTHDRFDLWRR